MKYFLYCLLSLLLVAACNSSTQEQQPEPHLELGQRIVFVGGNPDKTYIVAGYRQEFEDKTDTNWSKHQYIVFTYFNDQGDFQQGVVHRNAILKQ
ncbi:hypothetical protein [Cesiribacter andamanensis]|uniref:Uncharacterized protein n=1 Tax=Cesiribacter andamanensis AMV16 TaxID=1279009 RepID=M7NAU3_9BACT|nr:hypothetical protein [Cesiribacter andamanensis]EMR04387.1 hypothetical protein ADICEAN_00421 [Cesiribacter andamanensis AMV16]